MFEQEKPHLGGSRWEEDYNALMATCLKNSNLFRAHGKNRDVRVTYYEEATGVNTTRFRAVLRHDLLQLLSGKLPEPKSAVVRRGIERGHRFRHSGNVTPLGAKDDVVALPGNSKERYFVETKQPHATRLVATRHRCEYHHTQVFPARAPGKKHDTQTNKHVPRHPYTSIKALTRTTCRA